MHATRLCTNTVHHFGRRIFTTTGRYFIGLHDETRRILCAGIGLLCMRQDPRICVRTNTVQWAPVEQRYRGPRRINALLKLPLAQARCRVSHSRNTLLILPPAQTRCRASQHVYSHCASGIFMALRHGMNRHGADNAAERIRHCADRGLSFRICKRLAFVFVCLFDCVSSQQACRRGGGSKFAFAA